MRLSLSDLTELLSGVQAYSVTAPLALEHSALIGLYGPEFSSGLVCEVPFDQLPLAIEALYIPDGVPTYVHGLKRIWENYNTYKYLYVTKPDFLFDTRLMAYLLDPDAGEEDGLSLTHLCNKYLEEEYPYRIINIYDNAADLAFDDMLAYDACLIYRLGQVMPALMDTQLRRLYRDLELPFMAVLHEMRVDGIGVDGGAAQSQRDRTIADLTELDLEITGGAAVNLHSERELFHFLVANGVKFLDRGIYSRQRVDADGLEAMAASYPLVRKVLEWQALARDLSFLELASGKNRLHATWGQTRSGTSRIYARDPALQTVSRRLRHLFVPAPGCELIKADYSQAQMRILAHLSQDENLIALFRDGRKVHRETQEWLGIDYDSAKQVNFGICFGISAAGLAAKINSVRAERGRDLPPDQQEPEIDAEVAQSYIDGFYARYPGVREFYDREWSALKKRPQRDRVVKSLLGRTRRFGVYASSKVQRQFRVTWPQQIEADMLKTAVVRLDRVFRRRKMQARIVMMIHDSLWVEAPHEEVDQVRHLMGRMMTTALKLSVPLEVDFC